MTDLARDIAELLRNRPRPGADDCTWAAWFDRKADVFDAIADAEGPDAVDVRDAAARAREHARLRRSGGAR